MAFAISASTARSFSGAELHELAACGRCWHVSRWHVERLTGTHDFLSAAVADGQLAL
jgi:hypothetical protein